MVIDMKKMIICLILLFMINMKLEIVTVEDIDFLHNIYVENHQSKTSTKWYLVLVNEDNYLPDNYQIELTTLSNGIKVDKRILPALQNMLDDARKEELHLYIGDGYRTNKQQTQILDNKTNYYIAKGYPKKIARKLARRYVALPNTSEHELGISVDINADTNYSSKESVYNWLDNNAYRYGFIKRYPDNKTEITGINNEPWHYRYVSKKVAKIMKDKDLCLEEYLEVEDD